MNAMLTTIFSILAIAGLAWTAGRMLQVRCCPICLGVGGTWLWMIVGRALDYPVDVPMLSMLLGGSVVGIAYQVEKRLPQGRSPLLWKMLFVPVGFVAAYALATPQWALFAVTGVALVLLTASFLRAPGAVGEPSEAVDALQKKMRECC